MMLRCGVIWMLRTTCMVRKDKEQIQEGIKCEWKEWLK